MVMKKRRMSGCVTVTGPPAAICFLKMGITLPFDPSTLPKRTATYLVRPFWRARSRSSATRWPAAAWAARWRKDKDDQECRDTIGSEEFLDVSLWLDRAQGGLIVEPQLAHVIQACAEDVTLGGNELAPYIADPNLLADLHDLAASRHAKN